MQRVNFGPTLTTQVGKAALELSEEATRDSLPRRLLLARSVSFLARSVWMGRLHSWLLGQAGKESRSREMPSDVARAASTFRALT